jgi:H+/Cl- antiporter ClcA
MASNGSGAPKAGAPSSSQSAAAAKAPPADPSAAIRTRPYLALLALAAVLGVPLSAGAWGFLEAIGQIQQAVYTDLPRGLGFHEEPPWWPLLPLLVAGILVSVTIRYLPGTAGHLPAEGLKTTGTPAPGDLPGILIAALASISLGVVIGPEAPLIALGSGLAAYAVRLIKRDADAKALALAGAAGSFAAVSALFGSPLLGAFLLMEASGLGGAMLDTALMPGLLAAGIGSLIFTGLNSWSGLSASTLTIPNLPATALPDIAEFGWALVIGVAAAFVGHLIRHAALFLQPRVSRRILWLTPIMGLAVAGLAIAYAEGTGKSSNDVLFSGQTDLGPLIAHSAQYTAGTLVLLLICKGIAYSLSLSAFRGGPVFPSMFIGAAGGMALSHVPGLSLIPGIAMGIGAMTDAMLTLPLTAVLLATLLLGKDGVTVMPLVIVSVVVSHVVSVRIRPPAAEAARPRPVTPRSKTPRPQEGTS